MEPILSAVVLKEIISWRAMIDILLVATGLYVLYRALLGLGTWKIVTGILIAIVFFTIANLLDLKGIEWIFKNIAQVAAIGIIIIFQPEIRKLLERAASFRRLKSGKYSEDLMQMLAEATFTMAQKRQGAIIVIPGKESIEEWLSGGHYLNAQISVPLILSIFDPNSPGHDGALVFEGGRFTKFGVRLPLSQSSKLSDDYGTRHHAAMGLAEKTDAMAIVVSEERGKVAVFVNGNMQQTDDRNQLLGLIASHWQDTSTYPIELPKGKSKWFAFSQMMASLAIAVFFYSTLIIAQGEILEKFITIPVEYSASPSNLVLVGEKYKEVRIHLSGKKADLDTVDPDQLKVKIDLSKAIAGKQTFLITSENIKLSKELNLLGVVPQSIELELAEILEHEIAIKPQLVGKLPNGFQIRSIKVYPEKIRVLSPISQKKNFEPNVITTPIYLESISDDSKIFAKIIAPPSVQPVDKRWPDVQVIIKVERK